MGGVHGGAALGAVGQRLLAHAPPRGRDPSTVHVVMHFFARRDLTRGGRACFRRVFERTYRRNVFELF